MTSGLENIKANNGKNIKLHRMNIMNKKMTLFLTFLKIGAFTFGGGYAMIPLIQKEVAEERKWITDEDILDIVAIAESTPGPIAINTATFVGYKVSGFFGALLATLGVVLPSFVIISAISYIIEQFQNLQVVQFAFNGIRVGVLALVIKALVSMYKQCSKDLTSIIIAIFAFAAVAFLKISTVYVLIICASIGVIMSTVAKNKVNKK